MNRLIEYGEFAVPQLLQALDSTSQIERYWSIHTLGIIGDKRACKRLSDLLMDSDSAIRSKAASALGKIGRAESVPCLVNSTRDSDAGVRSTAAWALGSIRCKDAVEPLILLLTDKDSFVKRNAAEALGELKSPKSLDALVLLLSDEDASEEAAMALGAIQDKRAIAPLIKSLPIDPEVNNDPQAGVCISSVYEALEKLTGKRFVSCEEWITWAKEEGIYLD